MAYGDIKTATCVVCKQEFEYVFTQRERVVCNEKRCRYELKLQQDRASRSRRRSVRISETRHGLQYWRSRESSGFGPKPKVKRGETITKHDLQWSPTDDFARRVNQILQGERGLV